MRSLALRLAAVSVAVAGPFFCFNSLGHTATSADAQAASTEVRKVGGTITVTADSDVANDITIHVVSTNNTFRISDTADTLVARGTCEVLDDDTVSCPVPGTTEFLVDAGNSDDVVVANVNNGIGLTIEGAEGNDRLVGGSGNDSIGGGQGNDSIVGGAGNDTLDGGTGNDEIAGNAGNDTLDGGAGNDEIAGSAGNDTLDGGADNDELNAGAGNDTVGGGTGSDRLIGGSGIDELTGGGGNDRIDGVDGVGGNDTLAGSGGTDVCAGDPGDTIMGCP